MRMHSNMRRAGAAGFTLIELMIVIAIIATLVAVLALAIIPWLSKSEEQATRSLLSTTGAAVSQQKSGLDMAKFRKDAGTLSGQIDSDPKLASSQMMVFYAAPSAAVWQEAPLYKGRQHAPEIAPEQVQDNLRGDSNGLQHFVDNWETPLWYRWDKATKSAVIQSAGPDREWETDDDLVYMGSSGSVKTREELKAGK